MPNEAESELCHVCGGLNGKHIPSCIATLKPTFESEVVMNKSVPAAFEKLRANPPTESGSEVLSKPIPESIIYSRCAKHYQVPQQNKNEHSGHECGGCIAEERDWYKLQYEAIKIEINNRLDELETLRRRVGELEKRVVDQRTVERELEMVSTALGKERSKNNRLALENCGLAKELSALRQSHDDALVELAEAIGIEEIEFINAPNGGWFGSDPNGDSVDVTWAEIKKRIEAAQAQKEGR